MFQGCLCIYVSIEHNPQQDVFVCVRCDTDTTSAFDASKHRRTPTHTQIHSSCSCWCGDRDPEILLCSDRRLRVHNRREKESTMFSETTHTHFYIDITHTYIWLHSRMAVLARARFPTALRSTWDCSFIAVFVCEVVDNPIGTQREKLRRRVWFFLQLVCVASVFYIHCGQSNQTTHLQRVRYTVYCEQFITFSTLCKHNGFSLGWSEKQRQRGVRALKTIFQRQSSWHVVGN